MGTMVQRLIGWLKRQWPIRLGFAARSGLLAALYASAANEFFKSAVHVDSTLALAGLGYVSIEVFAGVAGAATLAELRLRSSGKQTRRRNALCLAGFALLIGVAIGFWVAADRILPGLRAVEPGPSYAFLGIFFGLPIFLFGGKRPLPAALLLFRMTLVLAPIGVLSLAAASSDDPSWGVGVAVMCAFVASSTICVLAFSDLIATAVIKRKELSERKRSREVG